MQDLIQRLKGDSFFSYEHRGKQETMLDIVQVDNPSTYILNICEDRENYTKGLKETRKILEHLVGGYGIAEVCIDWFDDHNSYNLEKNRLPEHYYGIPALDMHREGKIQIMPSREWNTGSIHIDLSRVAREEKIITISDSRYPMDELIKTRNRHFTEKLYLVNIVPKHLVYPGIGDLFVSLLNGIIGLGDSYHRSAFG
jgi:hypothetical protein